MPKYDPAKDIPSLEGKVILVTGGTNGLGAQTVLNLVAHSPAHIFFTGRSTSSADKIINDVKATYSHVATTFIPIDQGSLTSVRDGAKKFLSLTSRLDILICNAGIMAVPPGLTKDGYEIQFGINHLSHALLITLLLPLLLETAQLPRADVRIVNLTSTGYRGHPMGGIVFSDLKTTQDNLHLIPAWQRYSQSKLANILYASSLAKAYGDKGILCVSVHPGVFGTGLVKNLSWGNKAFVYLANGGQVKDAAAEGQGASNTCWAATSPREGVVNGAFYMPVGELGKKERKGGNVKLEDELWVWTKKELEVWVDK